MKFSVIIPVFDRVDFLAEAIQSVINQQVEAQIIIINDGSSAAIADRMEQICRLYPTVQLIYHEANKGVSAARNTGLAAAKGDWVVFLDDDDWLAESYLTDVSQHIQLNADTAVFISKCDLYSSQSDRKIKHITRLNRFHQSFHHLPVTDARYFMIYWPGIHGFVFRKSLFDDYEFDLSCSYGEDRLLLMQMRAGNIAMLPTNVFAGYYRVEKSRDVSSKLLYSWIGILKEKNLITNFFEKKYLTLLEGYAHLKGGQKAKGMSNMALAMMSLGVVSYLLQLFFCLKIYCPKKDSRPKSDMHLKIKTTLRAFF